MKMKMKFLLAPALVLMSGAGLWGQTATTGPATKIALINMQDALANTEEGKAGIAELDKKYGPKQAEFQKRQADIQAKQDQLRKTQNTLSAEAQATLTDDITKLKTNLQRDEDDLQSDSQADEQKMLQTLGPKLVAVVSKYAQENQIMLVFDLSSQPNNLVCCASAPDITREVIALYDKTNPTTGAAAPAAGAAKSAAPRAPARPAAPSK